MVTNQQFFAKYGHPVHGKNLIRWDVPAKLQVGKIPKAIFCNADIVPALEKGFTNLIERGLIAELKTWDGCYNLRPVRGYENKYKAAEEKGDDAAAIKYLSVHSWGCAFDVNAATNGLGKKPTLSAAFVQCFKDAGFDWGGDWQRLDGMHFQLAKI